MPPCNCHHPFPRPEPFSPLPRPGRVPDWGKWIRDRLAEKGALLAFPSVNAFPDPGAGPNLYLAEDTDIVYRWDGAHYQVVFDPELANDVLEYEDRGHFPETGHHGKLYIAADTGSLYRWDDTGYAELLPGKADKAIPQTAGNLAALDAQGNLADSGKKPADFQPMLTFDSTPTAGSQNPVTSAGIKSAIDAATPEDYAQVKSQVQTNTGDIAGIKAVIPTGATARNQLVDTATMNSSIATNTAHFLGTKSYVTDLGFPQPSSAADVDNAAIATALGGLTFSQTPTNNDYVFVSINYTPTTDVDEFRRFKFNGTTGTWAYEYTLNNSSFTAAQWAAINSGITAGKVAEIDGKKNNFDVGTGLVETSNTLYAYKGVAGTTTEGEMRYTIGPADVGSTVYSWNGSVTIPTGETVRMFNTAGRIYTVSFPNPVYYDRSAADDIVRPNVIAIDPAVVAKKTDIPAPSSNTPAVDSGLGSAGSSAAYARGDHVHPTDTSRMAATATGANIAVSGSDPTKIDAALAGKATKADATLNERFSAWTFSGDVEAGSQYEVRFDFDYDGTVLWALYEDGSLLSTGSDDPLSTSEDFPYGETAGEYTITATRTALSGYRLGPDDPSNPNRGKPLASEAEAEALRTGKQDALTAQQLANIAAVSNALAFDATHSYAAGDPVVYNGTLYTFTAAHTGAWTGSDVSAVDIIARLALKANDADVVHKSGNETIEGQKTFNGIVVVNNDISNYNGFITTMGITLYDVARGYVGGDSSEDHLIHIRTFADTELGLPAGNVTIPRANGMAAIAAGAGHTGNLAALDAQGNPTDSGVKPSAKLDSTSAAPAYSASATYSVGDHVTYNGALYVCSTAISTAEAWNSAHWTAEDMTTPDATLDVTATDKLLRLVATNGDVIWGQGYNLSTTSSATVLTEQVSAFTFAADAVADQAIVLPTVAASKVGDFILDVTNLSANDRSLTLTGLDSAFSVVVKAGDDLSETLTVAAGEMARYYFTMTAFRVNSLPTWQVAKEAVENGGAQS